MYKLSRKEHNIIRALKKTGEGTVELPTRWTWLGSVEISRPFLPDDLFDAVHCSKRFRYDTLYRYSRKKETNFIYDTFDIGLSTRTDDILIDSSSDHSLVRPLALIPLGGPYGRLDEEYPHIVESIADGREYCRFMFKHPETNTWFYVKHYSIFSDCDTCDGTTTSTVHVGEESSLKLMFLKHTDSYEKRKFFGNENFLVSPHSDRFYRAKH